MRARTLSTLALPLLLLLTACGVPGDDGGTDDPGDGTQDTTAPAVPTGLTAAVESGAVVLTWDAGADADLAAYAIRRGADGAALSEFARVDAGTTTFTDDAIVEGTAYAYAVVAEDTAGNASAPSAQVTATVEPPITAWFVDPGLGADGAAGTETAPFASLTHALSVATEGQTVYLAAGTYRTPEETFPLEIPAGVTVEPVLGSSAFFQGPGSGAAFHVGPGAALRNVVMRSFGIGVYADAGEVTLENLTLENNDTGVLLDSGVRAEVTDCTILRGTSGIEVNGSARLTMTGGRIFGMGPNCGGGTMGVYVGGASTARLEGVTIEDVEGDAIELRLTSEVTLVDSAILSSGPSGCGAGTSVMVLDSARLVVENSRIEDAPRNGILAENGTTVEATGLLVRGAQQGLWVSDGAEVTLADSEFTYNETGLYVGAARVTVTGSTFRHQTGRGIRTSGAVALTLRGTEITDNGNNAVHLGGSLPGEVDLGTAADPGGNTFTGNGSVNLSVAWDDGTVEAVGNLWEPGAQGANPDGTYPSQTVTGPFGSYGDANLYLQAGASVEL